MDWMTDGQINEEITALIKKMDPVRGKIFWRTFADNVHSAILNWLQPEPVDDSDDRVGMYWTTWIAHLKDVNVAFEDRIMTNQEKGLFANLVTGFKIVAFPFIKPFLASSLDQKHAGHAKDMESFYKYQKEGYDAFREGLLHARPVLMESFPLKKEGNMVWLDVGGGTARNLEFFPVEVIRKYFKTIVIVDISASLLEIAQTRYVLHTFTFMFRFVYRLVVYCLVLTYWAYKTSLRLLSSTSPAIRCFPFFRKRAVPTSSPCPTRTR